MPPSPRGGCPEGAGGYCWFLYIPQSKIKDFCQLLPKEKPRAVQGAGPYILKFKQGDNLGFHVIKNRGGWCIIFMKVTEARIPEIQFH